MNLGRQETPEIIRTICFQAVHSLCRQSGYGLIPEDVFIERLYIVATDSDEVLKWKSNKSELERCILRLAKQIYAKNLYQALLSEHLQDRENAYNELWKYLFRFAFNYITAQEITENMAMSLAEECTQDALLNIHRNLKKVTTPTVFLAYAMTTVKRECLHTLERIAIKEKHEVSPDDLVKELGLNDDLDIENLFSLPLSTSVELVNVLLECLMEALTRLKNKDWSTGIILKFFSGCNDKMIGEILHLSYSNVQTMRSRALEELRKDHYFRDCIET
jgi:RNA polymerase sigma factor (sigma-70 family)